VRLPAPVRVPGHRAVPPGILNATDCSNTTDIVKVNYLRENNNWSMSKLYFCFLWGEILIGVGIILLLGMAQPLRLVIISAAMNGFVMFIYSLILLYMNNKILSRCLSMSPLRFLVIVWSCAFFGYFSFQALKHF